MRILIWHVHGSYLTSLVQGKHTYLIPRVPGRGPEGGGRATSWDWPPNAVEVTPQECAEADVDLVVLQRTEELFEWAPRWLGGRRPGRDVPAVFLEHNAPQGRVNEMRHVCADHPEIPVVHVTHFNDLFWDTGRTRTTVIEHGVVDPGYRYTGELERIGVAVNEPLRRARVTGTDLLERFAEVGPLDVFGMKVTGLDDPPRITAHEDLPQAAMHREMARRRVYVHPVRWTSLGLSLIEAMHLGMPVVAVSATEVAEAVPAGAGVVSTDAVLLAEAARRYLKDPDLAREHGRRARDAALERYGLERFLRDWDRLYEELTA